MSLILNYMISFMFMRYILNMSITEIIMLQGFVALIVILYVITKNMKEFLDEYNKNSNSFLGKDKKIFEKVPLFKGRELIFFIAITVIIFIVNLKNFPINKPILENLYNWEIPLKKILFVFEYVSRIGLSLGIVIIIGYINYVFKLNNEMKKYNIEFEKYNYYLKYTFIKFLIYLSQISIIIISPFIFKSMNPFL